MNRGGQPPRDCADDAAAYLLGAMEPDEAGQYHRHALGCAVCRDELDAFAPVVDALPMAAPPHALPPGLRRRVLRAARAESRAGELARRGRTPGEFARRVRTPGEFARRVRTRRWLAPALRHPGRALAGAVALALVAVAVGIAGMTGGSSGSRVLQATVVNSAGTARLRIAGGQAELIVQHLPPPPAGRIYEIWLKRPNNPPAPTSALFSVTEDGDAEVGVPGNLHDVADILVTQEPAGGSRVSTHSPLIVAPTS